MTAFPGGGTALDRVGGLAAFRARVSLVWRPGVRLRIEVAETYGGVWHLYLVDRDRGLGEIVELSTVSIARSTAVREAQEELMLDDQEELGVILGEIVAALEAAAIPELEKRAMDGDR